MADLLIPEGSPIDGVQRIVRYRDMGDGSHAEVVTDDTSPGVGDMFVSEGSPYEGVQRKTRYRGMGDGTWARVVYFG